MKETLKFLTRRDLVRYLSMSAGGAALLPYLRPTVAFAQGAPSNPAVEIYIRIFLSGGLDGLTLAPPRRTDLYNALKAKRPTLMGPPRPVSDGSGFIPGTGLIDQASRVLDIGQPFGLNPLLGTNSEFATAGLTSIHELMNAGQAKLLAKVGFPTPDLNHTTAADYWNIGSQNLNRGSDLYWEIRLMQAAGLEWNQLWALGMGGGTIPLRPAAGLREPINARFLESVNKFSVNDSNPRRHGQELGGSREVTAAQNAVQQMLALPDQGDAPLPLKEFKRGMKEALLAIDSLTPIQNVAAPAYWPRYRYPDATSESFLDVYKIIKHYRVDRGTNNQLLFQLGFVNFDSHEEQDLLINNRLSGINHGVACLHKSLSAMGLWDKTVIQLVSEFGRDVEENSSRGTSHGYGSNLLLVGGALNPSNGVIAGGPSSLPTLDELTNPVSSGGSKLLGASLDPRSVYYEIIAGMGYDPSVVFPVSQFTPPQNYGLIG